MLFRLIRPALFAFAPETAHGLALRALRALPPGKPVAFGGPLGCTVAGIAFPNPLGMAAGFDKNGEIPDALLGLGFGYAEVGSMTPLPQKGNPKPRLFRLTEDRAVINRMGFNNQGAEAAARRLALRKQSPGVVGVNIGANKDSADRIADYGVMARVMAPLATYLAVNVSSPNTPGLRALQDEGALGELLDTVRDGASEACKGKPPPIFLKVAPDLLPADIDTITRIAHDKQLGALIVTNTTISRPPLVSVHAGESGGLSGQPLKRLALERLRDFRKATGGAIPLIGVGGIANAEDAWTRIRAGASLIQLYSAMVYEGPGIARRVLRGIEALMRRDGFASIEAAVGSE